MALYDYQGGRLGVAFDSREEVDSGGQGRPQAWHQGEQVFSSP